MTRWIAAALAVALAACAPPAPDSGPSPRAESYAAVVVWLAPSADTAAFAFRPEWRRAGAASTWAFGRVAAGERWAWGRMEGDTLVWSLGALAGDAGTVAEFAGVPEADGTVRGCLRAPRRGWAPERSPPRAAFVLRPTALPAPTVGDAPVDRC